MEPGSVYILCLCKVKCTGRFEVNWNPSTSIIHHLTELYIPSNRRHLQRYTPFPTITRTKQVHTRSERDRERSSCTLYLRVYSSSVSHWNELTSLTSTTYDCLVCLCVCEMERLARFIKVNIQISIITCRDDSRYLADCCVCRVQPFGRMKHLLL